MGGLPLVLGLQRRNVALADADAPAVGLALAGE